MNLKNAKSSLLLFLLLVVFGQVPAKPVPIRITLNESIGDTKKLRQVANSFLEPNALGFSKEETYKTGIRLLSKSSYFSTVDTSTVRGIKLVTLTPAYVIRNIDVKGKFPLFKKDILDALTVKSGHHITDAKLKIQKGILENRLKEFGFIAPEVTFSQLKNPETGEVDLTIDISKEGLYRITSLVLVGEKKYGFVRAFWAKIYSKLWRNGNGYYSKDEINESVDKLIKFYRNYDYYEADVKCETYFDDSEKSVSLVIKIDKGPKYKILTDKEYRGPLKKREVREKMDLSRKGNKNDFALKRSTYALQKLLREWGYTKARVTFKDSMYLKRGTQIREVALDVDSGTRDLITEEISTTGNVHLLLDSMKQVMLTRFNNNKIKRKGEGSFSRTVFKKDLESIEAQYLQKGFPFVDITSAIEKNGNKGIRVSISVEEGRRVFVDSVYLGGLDSSQQLLNRYLHDKIPVKKGKPFFIGTVFTTTDTLITLLKREGFYDCTVKPTVTFFDDSSKVIVSFYIKSGKKVKFNRIFFHGNFKTRETLMARMLGFEKGDVYSDSKLYKGIRRLRDIQNFRTVSYSVPERGAEREKLDLFVSVDEKEPYLLGGALGYDVEKQFYGRLYTENRNFLGLNKQFRIEGELGLEMEKNEVDSSKKFDTYPQGKLKVSYTEPHLFYKDIIASSNIYISRSREGKITDYLELGNSNNLTWKFTPYLTGFGELALELRGLQDKERRGVALEISPGIIFDKRDSFIRPRKGIVARFNTAFSYGLTQEEDKFIKYTTEFKNYVTPIKGVTIASRVGGGVIDVYGGSAALEDDQDFNLGGNASVRGYEKDMLFYTTQEVVSDTGIVRTYTPQSGYVSIYGSIESRIALPYSFEATLFTDGGTLGLHSDLKNLESPRFTYGGGLRYVTPVGSIGMIFGRKSRKNISGVDLHYYNDNKYKWDFSINYTF